MKASGEMFLCGRQNGFSLVEVLALVLALAIVASVAIGTINGSVKDRRTTETKREMEILAQAIVGKASLMQDGKRADFGYVGDIGSFPPDLDALVTNPGGYTTWRGPYVPPGFSDDSANFEIDAWGKSYLYSGGIIITSSGSGEIIRHKLANDAGEYLHNSLTGRIRDAADWAPGPVFKDSVDFLFSIPDGAGGMAIKSGRPDAVGNFSFDSLPVGRHLLKIIFQPQADTLTRYVTILPRHKSPVAYRFASRHFSGGSSPPGTEIIRPSGPGEVSECDISGCGENWECVSESTNDGHGSYVYQAGVQYKEDSYSASDHISASDSIDSLKISISCIGYGANARVQTRINSGGTDYFGATENINMADYTQYSTVYQVNPATNASWTWSDIDEMEIGLRLRAGQCTQVWAEIFFSP